MLALLAARGIAALRWYATLTVTIALLCCVRPHGLLRNLRETARSLKFNLTSWKQCRVLNIRGAQYSGTSI